ncbi:hypothetical protein KDH83_02335 [Achromobacter sp. Marseille-Q0513]|uniref:hypothetical protein n=1 Tax=Achromobacter sp. Marseille-Q0513 TaxID=2829161 RepID=UPI001BA1B4EF|nr:hypothetical protein [Achromobacter sp. Marseille-Q0513]MBR8652142.1 hypothetical protein [Achromobacter sp. Marseille-Q0513]
MLTTAASKEIGMYMGSGITRSAVFIAALLVGGVASAAGAVATEFPAASEIKPPANMPAEAKAIWDKQRANASKVTPRALDSSPATNLASIPVIERSFKPMRERVEQLAKTRGSLPEHLHTPWVIPSDVSKSPLGRCTLGQATPMGVEVDGKLTGQIRVFDCSRIGPVILTEDMLNKGGMLSLASADDVNAKLLVGGIERGVIASRLVRSEDKEEMTMVRWRSGDKSVTLRVSGTQAHSLEFVQETLNNIAD